MKNVSLVRCENYEYEKVKNGIEKSLHNLGGLSRYIQKGERVLLKVNLLSRRLPEEAVTTHPHIVRALCEILIANGNTVLIGDSPGGPFNEKILQGLYKTTGMAELTSTGAILNYNTKQCERANPRGAFLKKITVTDMLNDVDKVISLSKLKTHGMMTMTGAVKNLFGIVPGVKKAEYHMNMPEYNDFADALLDICLLADPVLSIMDGITGMEGAGPASGTPRDVNVIIASDSPFHLDKAASRIMNLNFAKIPTISRSIARGLCEDGMADVSIIGDTIEDFIVEDFKAPPSSNLTSMLRKDSPLMRIASLFLQSRPVYDHNLCIGCGVCAENCPAEIITMDERKKPSADLKKCIRCYCCQELCPKKAVSINRSWLLKLISR